MHSHHVRAWDHCSRISSAASPPRSCTHLPSGRSRSPSSCSLSGVSRPSMTERISFTAWSDSSASSRARLPLPCSCSAAPSTITGTRRWMDDALTSPRFITSTRASTWQLTLSFSACPGSCSGVRSRTARKPYRWELTLVLPELNVSRRQKYTVVALCSLGIFTLISSLLRLPYLHNLNQSTDPTWSVPNIVIWSIAELGSAITLSSIPAIRPLYAHVFQNRGKKNTSSSESGGTNPELPIPQPRRARAANIPFTIGTIGSIVDRSLGRSRARASSSESGHQLEAGVAASVAESRHSGRDGAQDSTFSKP